MAFGVLLELPQRRKKLRYESSFRVAAATLKHALAGEITSTKVIGTAGPEEDSERLRLLAREIAAEFDLESEFAWRGDSFSVRFSLPD